MSVTWHFGRGDSDSMIHRWFQPYCAVSPGSDVRFETCWKGNTCSFITHCNVEFSLLLSKNKDVRGDTRSRNSTHGLYDLQGSCFISVLCLESSMCPLQKWQGFLRFIAPFVQHTHSFSNFWKLVDILFESQEAMEDKSVNKSNLERSIW